MNAREALMDSFRRLIEQRPLDQITIRDIVTDCGVNRNSFYYHFENYEDLVQAVVMDDAEIIIAQYPELDSVERCMDAMINYCNVHRKAVMNIYSTNHRIIFERKLMEICENTIARYMAKSPLAERFSKEDRSVILTFYKCECFGQIIEWLNSSMKYDIGNQFHRICELGESIIDMLDK